MSYIEQSLSRDEEVEGLFTLHWFVWVPMVICIVLGLVTFGLTWIVALIEFLRIKFLEQGLTNKRVIRKTGIISRRSDEMKLRSIETVELTQGIIGRIFVFGSVKATGRGVSSVEFKYLANPLNVKRQIESVSNPLE